MSALAELVARVQGRSDAAAIMARMISLAGTIAPESDSTAPLRELADLACTLTGATAAEIAVAAPDGMIEELVRVGPDVSTDAAPRPELEVPLPSGGRLAVWGDAVAEGDTLLLEGLARLASLVIGNARLDREARLASRWIAASEEINRSLLSGGDPDLSAAVALIVDLADAAFVGLARVGAARFVAQAGPLSYNSTLERDPAFHGLARAVGSGIADSVSGVSAPAVEAVAGAQIGGFGPTMVIPWGDAGSAPDGAFIVARGTGGHDFTHAEREMAERFVRSVSTARSLVRARTDQERLALSEERDRIARDLHDHVIQSLFGVGLGLQSVLTATTGQSRARVSAQIDAIDVIIRQIRQTIFELGEAPTTAGYSLKQRLNGVVRTGLEGEAIDSSVEFSGPVDTLVDSELGDEVEAVVREALSNVVRHAHASRVDIAVSVTQEDVTVVVTDNGRGVGRIGRRSGLDNLLARASARGGTFVIASKAPSGTTLDWSVPVG